MNTFQATLTSPRISRFLFWLGAVVLAAGIFVLGARLIGGSDDTPTAAAPDFSPTLPVKGDPLKTADGKAIKTFGQLGPEVKTTIRTFLATAVARENLGRSWNVVAPSMKRGYTYNQWKNAKALPVVPYPIADVDKVNYSLKYALEQEILVDIGVFAKPAADLRPLTFQIGLVPVGNGAKKRWAVDYWMPLWSAVIPKD